MAEWSIAAVLKTVEGHTSGGSNPSLSAEKAARRVAFSALERVRTVVRYREALAQQESLSLRRKAAYRAAFFVE